MGLLDLFRKKTLAAPTGSAGEDVYEGDQYLEVVGESLRQEALLQLVGGPRRGVTQKQVQAVLIPEPDNPVDSNAIGVWVKGLQVGYIGREDARALYPGLAALIAAHPKRAVALNGLIRGMSLRHDGGTGMLGVHLNYNPEHFGLDRRPGLPQMRTGLSLATATDREDDSYDLSWWDTLDQDPIKRVNQLRGLLPAEHAPISRHSMMMELEYRLYRHRDDIAGALTQYDEIAELHHAELRRGLRANLIAKFGRLPELDTYRQASIRQARAKNLSNALEWAKRGLAMYGTEAARQEWVDDLQHRVERLTAQLDRQAEAAGTSKQGGNRANVARSTGSVAGVASVPTAAALESLLCGRCGSSFERVRTRGRKPMLCPACSQGSALPSVREHNQ